MSASARNSMAIDKLSDGRSHWNRERGGRTWTGRHRNTRATDHPPNRFSTWVPRIGAVHLDPSALARLTCIFWTSGRRDSNPRPSPWQKSGAACWSWSLSSSELHISVRLGTFSAVCYISFFPYLPKWLLPLGQASAHLRGIEKSAQRC